MHTPSPRPTGYRMPAEWEPHDSTWISWPHNRDTWPYELDRVERTIARIVSILSRSEPVRINVGSDEVRRRAQRALDDVGAVGEVRFHAIPTNDAWVRDYGPLFVVSPDHGLAATCWGFNSWGEKYPPFDLDDAAAEKMAAALAVPRFEADMILEGGSIDVNGRGVLLTTESCLLNPNRNPSLDRDEIEERLRTYLGIDQVIWLHEGLTGDDTDGHVDDLARFADPRTVVAAVEDDSASPDFGVLLENLDVLRSAETAAGPLEIIELPMPSPVVVRGEHMPATYANFYIGNRTVLVPTFGDQNDEQALSILRRCFPTRDIVGVDCSDVIGGLGAIHCLTQQVPWAR
ncbi:MAG: agmatine deiminase family protein [Rhodothermales bacterium]